MAEGNGSGPRWPDEKPAVSDLALENLRQSAAKHRRDIPAHVAGSRLVPAARLDRRLVTDCTNSDRIPMAVLAGDFSAAATARSVVARLLYGCRSRCGYERAAVHPGGGGFAPPGRGVRRRDSAHTSSATHQSSQPAGVADRIAGRASTGHWIAARNVAQNVASDDALRGAGFGDRSSRYNRTGGELRTKVSLCGPDGSPHLPLAVRAAPSRCPSS